MLLGLQPKRYNLSIFIPRRSTASGKIGLPIAFEIFTSEEAVRELPRRLAERKRRLDRERKRRARQAVKPKTEAPSAGIKRAFGSRKADSKTLIPDVIHQNRELGFQRAVQRVKSR